MITIIIEEARRHHQVELREKDDIIRDLRSEVERLRKQLTRLEMKEESMEQKRAYERKSTKKYTK